MIPEPITIGGKSGTVMYLDAKWHPVPPEQATMAKVLFDDGSIVFYTTVEEAEDVQSIAPEKAAGIGGITRKFDEAKHPRGEDGRFIEATSPRVFRTLEDVEHMGKMHGEDYFQWRKEPGHLLTGQPIPREQIPETLYHVTTNAPAVESSGVLLGLLESGGLGGGQEPGVSFTSSREDAEVILRELRRAVAIARGDTDIDTIIQWAREDEKTAGLPEGSLAKAIAFSRESWDVEQKSLERTFVWDKDLPEVQRGWVGPPPVPEERERIKRSMLKDALNAYLNIRERIAEEVTGGRVPILKNPLLFGRQEHLAKLKPTDIQILEIPSAQIPSTALVTTGSDTFLHEVRVYADVPMRRRSRTLASILKYDPNQPRHPKGVSEGGQFAATRAGARAAIMEAAGIGVVGVDDHPVAIRAAHEVAAKLKEMRARGYPMPREVIVQADQGTRPHGEALPSNAIIITVPRHLPPEMSFDEAMKVVSQKARAPEGINPWTTQPHPPGLPRFASETFQDIVVHEMGHVLRQPTIPSPYITRRSSPEDIAQAEASSEQLQKELAASRYDRLQIAANTVSQYASQNPDEFVAEVFTILYNGGTLPPDTLAVYEGLRGAVIR